MQSIFQKATNNGSYLEFPKPVVENISAIEGTRKILDIGTGPGTLPQLLINNNSNLQITGIDVNTAMSISRENIIYQYQKINSALEFDDSQFDMVTFCSVLFFVDDRIKTFSMSEAVRVIKPNGKIVLSPTGI
jgi:ubiquinone/menaquinone biosynthesis C-methylase UbiE